MDTKRMIIWTTSAMAIVLAWLWLTQYVQQKYPAPPAHVETATTQPTTQTAITQASSGVPVATTQSGTTAPSMAAAPPAPAAPGLSIVPRALLAESATLGSATRDDPNYVMQVQVTPEGAGLGSVLLNQFSDANDFKLAPTKRRPYIFQERYPDVPDSQSLATRSITVDNQTINLAEAGWTREPSSAPNSASYSITLKDAAGPVLKLTKTYTLPQRSDPSQGYELQVSYAMQNLTDRALSVKSSFNGPTLPPPEQSRTTDRQVVGGYKVQTQSIEVDEHPLTGFKNDSPTIDLTKKGEQPLEWAGTVSTYFAAFVLPTAPGYPAAGAAPAGYIAHVAATAFELDNDKVHPDERPALLVFDTVPTQLAPRQTVTQPMRVYLGPRWRQVLDSDYYSAFPRGYNESLMVKGGSCGFLTFGWLVKAMVALLSAFHWVAGGFAGNGSWGIAIVLLVAIVRTALHPIMKRSQVQMMKMGKMGPEIEKLKKKYGDNKEELNKAMMQVYKEQGFAPVLGCLPMLLQMPIWIALYSALYSTFELRQAPFLWGLTWIRDLSRPDYLIHFGHYMPVPVIGWYFTSFQFDGINLLPILMAVAFWLQQKYTPKPMATTPEQAQQQKWMQWMSLLFPVFLYNGPSGLNVYILTSTAIGVVEAKIIRDHIRQRDEAAKGERILIDTKPTRAGKRLAQSKDEPIAPAKSGGWMAGLVGWWADIQEKIDQERSKRGR